MKVCFAKLFSKKNLHEFPQSIVLILALNNFLLILSPYKFETVVPFDHTIGFRCSMTCGTISLTIPKLKQMEEGLLNPDQLIRAPLLVFHKTKSREGRCAKSERKRLKKKSEIFQSCFSIRKEKMFSQVNIIVYSPVSSIRSRIYGNPSCVLMSWSSDRQDCIHGPRRCAWQYQFLDLSLALCPLPYVELFETNRKLYLNLLWLNMTMNKMTRNLNE